MNHLSAILAWLQAQAGALFATVGNVASNRPEPARQVVIDVVILGALVFFSPKLIKLVSK